MIDFSELKLENMVVHHVGNKLREEDIRFSKTKNNLSKAVKETVLKYFLTSFKTEDYYNLHHDSNLMLNEVYSYVSEIFTLPENLFAVSENLAKHLYNQSTHPKIKGGEFYVVSFSECIVDGELVDAVGLFKSENRETYLKVYPVQDNYEIDFDDGFNINKLDKGAIIFNTEKENGYLVAIVDNASKGNEAQYWKDDFLHVIERKDEYHHTQNVLHMCKDFVINKLPEDFEISKADQVDILNKSLKFFKERENYNLEDYTKEVITQPDMIDSFQDYRKQFQSERQIEIQDEFEISTPALKKQSRIFKSVIKLDKNFHIYIHGNQQMIERGVDETTGMSFYKLFFKEEN